MIHQQVIFRMTDDLLLYLAAKTKAQPDDIREVLSTHPHYQHLCIANMKNVIELLASWNFTEEQIYNGVHLILYPVSVVAMRLDARFTASNKTPESYVAEKEDPFVLQIIVYDMEKQYNFSGSGVFAKSSSASKKDNYSNRLSTG